MSSLEQKILSQPWEFELMQVVRLLEGASPAPGVGEGPPSLEPLRLRPEKSLGFPPAQVAGVEQEDSPKGIQRWVVTQQVMGLYGVGSPLPAYIPQMIAQAYQDPDPLRDLLDIFNHRLVSLYYRVWKAHQLWAGGQVELMLAALVGAEHPGEGWRVAPARLLKYAGLVGPGQRSAAGLEALVEGYFGLESVEVVEFYPVKVALRPHECTRLGQGPQAHSRLGLQSILGREVVDHTGTFLLRLGPMDLETMKRFMPGGVAFAELVFLVGLYTRRALGFVIEYLLETEQVQGLRLGDGEGALGWGSWLGQPKGRVAGVKVGVV